MAQYYIEAELSPDLARLSGRERILYTNAEETPLGEVYLSLYPNLWQANVTISDTRAGGQPVAAEPNAQATNVRFPLAAPLQPGGQVELELAFTIPIVKDKKIGNYSEFAFQDGILALAHFYPTLVVFDGEWQLDTPSPIGDVIYADASLFEVRFTAPADWKVAATGANVARTEREDGRATWHLAGGPMRDFNIAASSRFEVSTREAGDTTIRSYHLPEHHAAGERALSIAAIALETFEGDFGPYPYRELEIVATPTTAGGVEYPGMIVVSYGLYADEGRSDFFEAVIAHEAAHQWWYNVVGNDQRDEPWLDESMSQYSTYLYYARAHGPSGARGFAASLTRRWEGAGSSNKALDMPVRAYSEAEYSGVIYGRGALWLISLREQLGADTMSRFLQEYYRDFRWKVAGTGDFQAVAEKVSGRDLDEQFNQNVYPPGG